MHDMLKRIPSFAIENLFEYLQSANSKLTIYEIANKMFLLELAIWKSKMLEQSNGLSMGLSAAVRSQCRRNCGACVIIPHVLSMLEDRVLPISWFE